MTESGRGEFIPVRGWIDGSGVKHLAPIGTMVWANPATYRVFTDDECWRLNSDGWMIHDSTEQEG